jgi:hypothetical protein
MLWCVIIRKKYISLSIYNSDDVVMLRKIWNFHLRIFVKGGALPLQKTLQLAACLQYLLL